MWAGPLSGGRWVAVLFNRSPSADDVTLDFAHLRAPDDEAAEAGRAVDAAPAPAFDVYEVWTKDKMLSVTKSITLPVDAHNVALLILTPVKE